MTAAKLRHGFPLKTACFIHSRNADIECLINHINKTGLNTFLVS